MKSICKQGKEFFFLIIGMLMTSSILADLPQPPQKDIANGTNDWIDVGGNLTYRILSITCIALGVLTLLAVAAGIVKAYNTAHEKQDLGHFFKMLVVGLGCAALGIGLVYGGYNILPSQG